MFKVTKNDGRLAELEQAIADAKAALEAATAAYRTARVDLEIATTDVTERSGPFDNYRQVITPEHLQAYRTAVAAELAAGRAKAEAITALAEAERVLDLARTGPQRAETADTIRKRASRVETAMAKLADPLAELARALDEASLPEVLFDRPGSPLFYNHMLGAYMALRGQDGPQFVTALRTYANQIVAGERSYNLRPTVASEQINAGLRKSA